MAITAELSLLHAKLRSKLYTRIYSTVFAFGFLYFALKTTVCKLIPKFSLFFDMKLHSKPHYSYKPILQITQWGSMTLYIVLTVIQLLWQSIALVNEKGDFRCTQESNLRSSDYASDVLLWRADNKTYRSDGERAYSGRSFFV